jgi:sugar transferase (PEP-CTERM/EpsH1 system associated)
MKILLVTPRVPFPPYRGDRLKVFNLARSLKKRNEVKIVAFLLDPSEEEHVRELQKYGLEIETVRLSRVHSLFNLNQSLYTSNPLQVSYYSSRRMSETIAGLTSTHEFDVVYFHLFITAQYHQAVSGNNALKVLDFTDSASLYLARYLHFLKNPLKRLYFRFDLAKVTKYEHVARHFDTLFVCSDVDRRHLQKRNVHENIQLFMNGFDSETFKCDGAQPEKSRIVFTGNMPYFPNRDGVLYFVKEIFPLVLRKIPEATFYVVGQNPSQEIRALHSNRIVVTGFVPDIRKEYLKSAVNIAPIRFGSGTLNKVIEALALGVPTVATSLSIMGLPDKLKRYIFTADTPDQFAQKVVDVMTNRDAHAKLMQDAVGVVNSLLSWDAVVKGFEDYLSKRIELRRREQ